MSEIVPIAEKAFEYVQGKQKELEQKQQIVDYDAVKLEIRVSCQCGPYTFAPPLKIRINGQYKPQEINGDPSNPQFQRNCVVVWHEVPVRQKGADELVITLEATDGAERYFDEGRSRKGRFKPAFSRNRRGTDAQSFEVPPPDNVDRYDAHRVRIVVAPKRRWIGLRSAACEGIPYEWRVDAADKSANLISRSAAKGGP